MDIQGSGSARDRFFKARPITKDYIKRALVKFGGRLPACKLTCLFPAVRKQLGDTKVAAFIKQFEDEFGHDLGPYGSSAWSAVETLALLRHKALVRRREQQKEQALARFEKARRAAGQPEQGSNDSSDDSI